MQGDASDVTRGDARRRSDGDGVRVGVMFLFERCNDLAEEDGFSRT